ncbi:MAG: biopolymer transporter ExbD [Pseudomonadota bacterium]
MDSIRLQAKKKYRVLKRTIPEEDPISHLNIVPMMDMMTILIVFFLKNFSVSAENVNLGEDMMLPKSNTQIEAHRAVSITITKRALLVENEPIAAVKKGEVGSDIKRDGQSSIIINPLLDILQKHATRLKRIEQMTGGKMKFEGEIVVLADRTTPYRLISEVLYTAGQAEYGKYRLMVLKGRY